MAEVGALPKEVLVDEGEAPDRRLLAGLFEELAGQGGGGGLAELDVPAGEVVVVALEVLAEEDLAVAEANAAGDEFDFKLFHVEHSGGGIRKRPPRSGGPPRNLLP